MNPLINEFLICHAETVLNWAEWARAHLMDWKRPSSDWR